MPTWQLLGGFRKEIPAYASTVTYASVEEYLDVADQCAELGYPALKLHAFGDAREDARLCEAVREHVGSDVPLMYDGANDQETVADYYRLFDLRSRQLSISI